MIQKRFTVPLLVVTVLAVAAVTLGSAASGSTAPNAKGADEDGMAQYHASERGGNAANGMAIYHASERGAATVPEKLLTTGLSKGNKGEGGLSPNAAGLSIYQASERSGTSGQAAGLEIFHESEWGSAQAPSRLFDGKPFNAYQRSEWLGADR